MPGSLARRLQRRGGIWLGREARHQLRPYPHRARRVGALGFETRHPVIGPELVGELFEGLAPYLFGLSRTPVREWLGGVVGLFLGARFAAQAHREHETDHRQTRT